MQKEGIILEWILLLHKPNTKFKTYMEMISKLNLKEKLRLCQLTEIDPAEIIVPCNSN